MNTTSNISTTQSSGVSNTPLSQAKGRTPHGLLGFLEALIQQISVGDPNSLPAQTSTQGLDGIAEKIADALKKNGISEQTLKNMSPQDLAAKITALIQQGNITLPPALQGLSPDDLAAKIAAQIQQDRNILNKPVVKPSLTSDLIAPHSANIQEGQSKDDIAKKISAMLEGQQQGATTAALNPTQLQQLKDELAQLQSAPGTLSPDTLKQLTDDMGKFLASQGVSQSAIQNFVADLTQVTEKDQNSANTSGTQTTTPVAAAIPTVTQTAPQTSTPAANAQNSAPQDTQNIYFNAPSYKGILPQGFKPPVLGGKDDAGSLPQQLSADANVQQQISLNSLLPQPQNLTAKITGLGINPALISDLVHGDGSSSGGFGDGFGSQGNSAQQQDPIGNAAALQPMTADMLVNQNFTNYLSAARSDASQTTQLLNIQLQNNINSGLNSMTIQLEPADLGKLNVKLSFSKDGSVKAHMTVDKPETLALLQKDSHHLQRALQQSGLDADETSISFDLSQQGQQQSLNGFNGGGSANKFAAPLNDNDISNALQAQIALQAHGYITSSGVNIMV